MEEKKKFQHPEGKIQLLDGRVLDCYQSQRLKCEPVDNGLKIDTSGVYLSMKKTSGSRPVKDERDDEEKELDRLFLNNAFVLLNNRERILSDSRMFLCPLPIHNGLAYTGTSGFHRPTLGIYIEFWLHCPTATVKKDNGEKWLLWHISGSPLSGCNRCSLVNPQGETKCEQVASFSGVWRTFMEVNARYDEAKSKYDAYTLRQVLTILDSEGKTVNYENEEHVFFLEQTINDLKRRIYSLQGYANHILKKYHHALFKYNRDELKTFIEEYDRRKIILDQRVEEIQEERVILRKRMKSNEIDHKEYQKLWMPLGREKRQKIYELHWFATHTLTTLLGYERISLEEVREYLEKGDKILEPVIIK